MSKRSTGERYRLTVRSEPSDVPAHIRLKQLLKRLLRSWEFRCEVVEELTPAPRYTVPASTPCEVKRVGAVAWRPHQTKEALTFERYERLDAGRYEFLREGGWLVRVESARIVCQDSMY